jgi:arginine decarboxylase
LAAGIGNLNLLRVSSVLPPGAEYVEKLSIPPGSLTPTAYGTITSVVQGQQIAAAVGIGFTKDTFGMIMEYSGLAARKRRSGSSPTWSEKLSKFATFNWKR